MQVSEEGCDDGNTVNGDGCSSTCTVESGWACYNGSTTTTSVCLIADTYTITTKYVMRIVTDNIMRVAFKITPEY